jgi:HAMP domain-containing protein
MTPPPPTPPRALVLTFVVVAALSGVLAFWLVRPIPALKPLRAAAALNFDEPANAK